MKTYPVCGIVNANMYNTLLDPSVSLEYDSDDLTAEQVDALWDSFDIQSYIAKVCELAVAEFKKLLKRLPESLCCSYVEGSAEIWSPTYYNYFGDTLQFKVAVETDLTEKAFQAYLDEFFRADWDAEFGPDYAIYAYFRENCSIYDFQKEASA